MRRQSPGSQATVFPATARWPALAAAEGSTLSGMAIVRVEPFT